MTCPHCLIRFHQQDKPSLLVGTEPFGQQGQKCYWWHTQNCPSCEKIIVWLCISGGSVRDAVSGIPKPSEPIEWSLIWPKGAGRPPLPPEVPQEFSDDYKEACLVIADSPNASAALSRRCLQHLLREKAGVKQGRLIDEIKEVISSGALPTSIVDIIDIPRKMGNVAAHPLENDAGVIVPVEPWQAEWCLEVIEALFDHYFVTPARNAERIQRLCL